MVFKLPVAYPTVIRESIGVIVFLWAKALPLEVIRKKRLQIVSLKDNTNITKKAGIWLSGYPLFFDMGYKNYIVNVDEYNKPLDWGKSSGRLYLTDYILGDILWSIRLKQAIVYSQVYS